MTDKEKSMSRIEADVVDIMNQVVAHWTSPLGDDLHEYSSEDIVDCFEEYAETDFMEQVEWKDTTERTAEDLEIGLALSTKLVKRFLDEYIAHMIDHYESIEYGTE